MVEIKYILAQPRVIINSGRWGSVHPSVPPTPLTLRPPFYSIFYPQVIHPYFLPLPPPPIKQQHFQQVTPSMTHAAKGDVTLTGKFVHR